MTTYELPPEPPIGSRVRGVVQDANEPITVWTHDPQSGAWIAPGPRPVWMRWSQLLDAYHPQGLTLIEPDPWPTAPLIVATMADGHRTLLMRTGTAYESTTRVAEKGENALTNVVPVTVVPTAEWEALTVEIRDHGVMDYSKAVTLIDATDRLGLDQ